MLQYEKGTVQLYIDGALVLKTSVCTLNHGNDANLTGGQFTVAGFHCNGVQIGGAIPWPQATKTYRIGARAWWQRFSFNPTTNKLRWTMSGYATMVVGK